MTIELQKLEYDNMFSYGLNNIIQFNENPVTQLTAPNGSGKSSIALIIQEILYSKNVKGIKKTDIANRYSNTNSWLGELSFKVNNNEYIVKVTRKGATSKVYLEENGKDISEHKIPDTYKKIRDILGMDFEIFSQLTYQSSVDLLDFLKATDTNRKKFLINLFNLQKYIEIGEIVKTTLNLAEKELAVLDGKLQGIEDFIQNTVIGEIQTLKDVPEVDNLLVEKQRELLEEVKNYEVLCKKIDKNMSYREDLNRLDFDVNRNAPDELTMEINKNTMDSYSKTLIEYTVQQQDIIIQSGKLDLSDTCYACGHLLDNTQAKELEDKLKDKLETIRVEMSNIQTLYDTRQLDQAVLMHKKREYIINQQNIEKF